MRRITGTHVYSYVKCPRLAALDLHLPRSERRPSTEWEEFAARRGRDFEDQFVAGLPIVAPSYPERDFEAGAVATRALLTAGQEWIHQAVLLTEDRLGLPDLLRRLPGGSDLGEHHYEVIDVKTSGRPRSDQILQVVFYTRLLAELQGRMPTHGALVLKDGREERFAIADYEAAGREVEAALRRLRDDMTGARPFLQSGCSGCYHDVRCLPEMTAAQDLSLVHGMSHGAKAILEDLGCRTIADLATFHPDGARHRGNLEAALVRRLRRGAQAYLLGKPLVEERPRHDRFADAALVHLLTDAYAGRVLAFGVLHPVREDGAFAWQRVPEGGDEWQALKQLLAEVPDRCPLLHFGGALPRWYAEHAFERQADTSLEARFVDLDKRLHHAAVHPRAVFGLADLVRHALGRDPLRAGHAGAAAMWTALPDADERLRRKLLADLQDLAALKAEILDGHPHPEVHDAPPPAVAESS
ncbi:MAG: TM0106 family RecB-like putative nuclease [Planctomycetes bacterium]|nr:TM0106 family RecB-like putative nuclease [Planctomycetota bacterium]MCB9884601.1 TM0106 family RecB-like putative nuclease [Planctomycetota bacterium]